MDPKMLIPNSLIMNYNNPPEIIKISDDYMVDESVRDLRLAAECHRKVREYINPYIIPGAKVIDICERLENKTRELLGNTLHSGIGFPTGFSINNCVAHDSALVADQRVLKKDDIIKVDFGTASNGYIIDSAYTVTFDPKYNILVEASKEAMWAGINKVGPDALINDISEAIKETIESYELELNGKIHKLYSSSVLGGHNIQQWLIHGGKLILGYPSSHTGNVRLNAGEQIAIEVFPNTYEGNMYLDPDAECSLYSLNPAYIHKNKFKFKITSDIYKYIISERKTLPFSSRWINTYVGGPYKIGINELLSIGAIIGYPPIITPVGTYSSQHEHTLIISEYGKEILSHGLDY